MFVRFIFFLRTKTTQMPHTGSILFKMLICVEGDMGSQTGQANGSTMPRCKTVLFRGREVRGPPYRHIFFRNDSRAFLFCRPLCHYANDRAGSFKKYAPVSWAKVLETQSPNVVPGRSKMDPEDLPKYLPGAPETRSRAPRESPKSCTRAPGAPEPESIAPVQRIWGPGCQQARLAAPQGETLLALETP